MGNVARRAGDDWDKRPGTSNQTGNSAPRYPYMSKPIGRTVRMVILCIAYHLGFDDDRMSRLQERPEQADQYRIFVKTMPWFPGFYNGWRVARAADAGYSGPMEPFGPSDVANRLLYQFQESGVKETWSPRRHVMRVPKPRRYGVSAEHPSSPAHGAAGDFTLRSMMAAHSDEIMRRLSFGEEVSMTEAMEWGAEQAALPL